MIQAQIVADSITEQGHRLTTLEVIMPRYILAEFNTHRVLSKNSASSRAIPLSKMVKSVKDKPFIPYAWQKDHKGMQGTEYFTEIEETKSAEGEWLKGKDLAIQQATWLNRIGVTKQLANRLLEPFMYHKVLVSGTEWENFFNLRCPSYTFHTDEEEQVFRSRKEAIACYGELEVVEYETGNKLLKNLTTLDWLQLNTGQADIHIMFLAEAMYDAISESTPKLLREGDWHIPYGDNFDKKEIDKLAWIKLKHLNLTPIYLELRISIARCARLSYQTLGDNPVIDYEKDLQLYEVLSKSGHWSPFEHVAQAMGEEEYRNYINGHTSRGEWAESDNKSIRGWCKNFRGFIQYRALLD